MSNVQPGDLAIVIRPLPLAPNALGMTVEVLDTLEFKARIRAPRPLVALDGVPRRIGWVRKASLWPVRHPGDDARDEMLRPLPAPMEA
jgi:hypothetical protein